MVVMHMVRMMSMNLTMLRYKHKRGKAKPRKDKPKSEGSACGSSTHSTEIVLSTLNVPLPKQVPSLLL